LSNFPLWLVIGFVGQALFTARFVVQWWVSEQQRDSVVPIAFWWLSLVGGTALLAYAISRRDPVIISGQTMGLFVYTRNLMLAGNGKAARSRARVHSPELASDALAYRTATMKAWQVFIEQRSRRVRSPKAAQRPFQCRKPASAIHRQG
jgi:lipid-A-disaccharide synthase-like uncharacterized protein